MNQQQFLVKLGRHINEDRGGVTSYAKTLGVSAAYVSAVKNGKKSPSKAILDDMGYERITEFRFKKACL